MANYTPGQEPVELQKYLNPLLKELHEQYPYGLVDMAEWNHSGWDKVAGYLVQKLGYPNGTAFLKAYGFDIYNPAPAKGQSQDQSLQKNDVPKKKNKIAFCPNCGSPLDSAHKFCPSCGASLFVSNSSNSREDIVPERTPEKEDGIGYLVVERTGSTFYRYDNLAISIDGKTLSHIAQGKTITFNIPAGTHKLGFLLDNGVYCEDSIAIHKDETLNMRVVANKDGYVDYVASDRAFIPAATVTPERGAAPSSLPVQQGTVNNVTYVTQPKKKGCLSRIISAFIFLLVLGVIGNVLGGNRTNSSTSSARTSSRSSTSTSSKTQEPKETYLFNVANTKTNMNIKQINKDGSFYIGLAAVKSLNYIQTATSWHTVDIPSNQEVIYVFLDVYNDSGKIKSFREDISVYADSAKGSDPDTYSLVGIDGYQAYNSYEMDPETRALVIDAFIINKGWKELTVFCGDLSWKISPSDLMTSSYNYSSLYNLNVSSTLTPTGTTIYSDKYRLVYDNSGVYDVNGLTETEHYSVFMFTVQNTSDQALDYDNVGHNMRGYQNLRLLDGATWAMNDNIEGYTNVFELDEIKPGMSAKIYVAFPIKDSSGVFTCVYDSGYLFSEVLGTVTARY